VHSRQAWRLVQQLARKGRPVGIVDLATRRHLPTGNLESCRVRQVRADAPFHECRCVVEYSTHPTGLDQFSLK
jgi:hypothetical protein